MSRKSQSYWKHGINNCSSLNETDVRYSLTFRHVSNKFLRSTVVIGDSNTKGLRFGEGIGTFGHNIPGRQIDAIHIEDIKPVECCGFKNIFLHCGINNIKHPSIRGPDKVTKCFEDFKSKVEQVCNICPKSKIVVSPILPTKDRELNKRTLLFNKLLFEYESQSCGRFSTLDFNEFCDINTGFLDNKLGSKHPNDKLHLGVNGIRVLVKLVRCGVYGYDRTPSRPHNNNNNVKNNSHKRDGRSYRSALAGQKVHDWSLSQT